MGRFVLHGNYGIDEDAEIRPRAVCLFLIRLIQEKKIPFVPFNLPLSLDGVRGVGITLVMVSKHSRRQMPPRRAANHADLWKGTEEMSTSKTIEYEQSNVYS